MADLENSAQLAKEALDELRKAGSLSAKTLDKLNAAAKALDKDIDKSIEAIDDEVKAREKLTKDLIGLAKNIGSAAQSVRENREDFRSLGPAVDATAQGLKMSLGGVAKGMDSLGGILSGVGAVLPGWGKLVGVFGAAVSGAGKAVQKYGAEAVDAAAQYAKFSLGEIQRVVGAFQTLGDVGGITGASMRGLMKDAQALGLSVDTYAKLIARNSEGLAATTGTVTGGADVLKKITTAGTEFEDKFLKLGFSFEQQSEFSARFLAQQRNLVRINLEDTKALSEANRKYMEQVDELARLTGQSRDKVAGELEAMSRELRFGATLAIAEQKGTADSIRKAAKVLETQGSKEISEGFKDIFGGATTQRSQELMAATGGAAAGLADDLENGRISFAEFMQKFQQSVRETRQALGADEFERRVGKLGTVLDPMLVGMRRLDKAQDLNSDTLNKANKEQKEATENKDKETQNVIDAQKSLRDFAVTMDKIVSDKLFPTMATSVKYFTSVISEGADKIAKILGVSGTGGGGGRGAATGIPGAPSNNPSGAGGRGTGVQQAPTTGVGGAGAPTPEAAGTLGAIRNMIGKAESGGDYNVMVGGKKGDLTNMTLAQILEQQSKMTQRGSGFESSALGKYQITRATLMDLINKTGLDINTTKFDQATQDKLADELIVSRGGYNKYAAGAINKERFMRNLSSIWAGLPMDASGRSFYQGVGSNKSTIGFEEAMGSFAYGGISAGPKSGYLSMMHGTEAVIPLPGGRNVPVEMTGMSDRMGEQVSILTEQVGRFDQMIGLLQSSVDMQGKIYRATVN
jgi:muramidase (phage lysozyme)